MEANFCLQCGHPLETRNVDGTDRRACPACSFVHWGHYSIGVGALVMRGEGILLVRRAQEPGKGLWTNPGGYTKQFELLEDTVVREVEEETGVKASVEGVVALRDAPRTVHNLYVVFKMRYESGEPKPDGYEVDQAGFFTRAELAGMQVAALTRWLVDVAFSGPSSGLQRDWYADASLKPYGLFRRWR
ncbi:MAG: NUDIX hydrolase [Alicyclobacillus sp.]|nr:NUDIX hydrolase [Alicyclobacillus sp.]